MTMRAFCLSFVLSAAAQAQPPSGKPGFFPPIGGNANPGQFVNSSVGLLANQVVNELGGVKSEIARSPVPPIYKPALLKFADAALLDATHLKNLSRNATIEQLRAADATMDVSMQTLETQLGRFANFAPAAQEAMARANLAEQQLHNALHSNPGGGWNDAKIERVRRLTTFLEEQSESLRDLSRQSVDGTPASRELEHAARAFSFIASRFDRKADDAQTVRPLSDDFAVVIREWQKFGLAYRNINPSHPLRLQATRVENTLRTLSEMIPPLRPGESWDWDLPAPPPPGPNPGPFPPPNPGWGFLNRGAFVVGAGEGGGPRVRVFANVRGDALYDFFAYDPNFAGGVRVAVADLTGDRIPDLVTAPGPGMPPLIRVFNGRNMRLISEFYAFEPRWTGGVYVAAADRTRDGKAWIAISADKGAGPHVKVFDLNQGKEIDSFFAYDQSFLGGVRIALGDVNGDGTPDVVTVPGPGLEPRVKVFDGRNRNVIGDFLAFDSRFQNGLTIDASDLSRNGRADLIVGTDAGPPAVVRIFDAANAKRIGELIPFPREYRGGVRVAAYDFDGDGVPDVACAPGRDPASPAMPIKIFSGVNTRPLGEFFPFGLDFRGGAFLGSR